MISDMLQYYNIFKTHNINLVYCGPIWADGVEGIGGTLKKRLEIDELTLTASHSVFSVFVELMNNMLMYSAETECHVTSDNKNLDVSRGLFVLGSHEKHYFIQSGNMMRTKSVELIKSRIDHLNTLDKAEMRKFYKEQLKKEDTNQETKGAGLGFIEIARRASSKIEYDFSPLGCDLTFFSMFVTIG